MLNEWNKDLNSSGYKEIMIVLGSPADLLVSLMVQSSLL